MRGGEQRSDPALASADRRNRYRPSRHRDQEHVRARSAARLVAGTRPVGQPVLCDHERGSAPDRLLSISAPGTARSVRLATGTVPLAANRMVLLTGPAPEAVLTDLTRRVTGGSVIHLVLTFQNAGTVAVSVPVMPRAQYYSTYFQPPTPTPTPTPTAHARHHHHASPGAASSPSPSPSP